ncbi:hypothetical protein KP509_36G012700 [Ceratopteris richardii]|uniref:Uncharacterized protein n=1 Tax=Ceratopteris richardii TaxID=49495 RepID=A0A8T2Q9H4_CERRI|nr:hypothetical protein KP509_36G012700 [Ceratopteris richardii]KAH7280747.1 hypothetical protein KP509_36G012700 [Ceratopteris richardii]
MTISADYQVYFQVLSTRRSPFPTGLLSVIAYSTYYIQITMGHAAWPMAHGHSWSYNVRSAHYSLLMCDATRQW